MQSLRRSAPSRQPGLAIGVVLVAAAVAFVFSFFGPAAQAFPRGQIAHTGSPEVGGATCANCHQGSDLAASLTLDAPTSATVGETITITLTLRGGPGAVGGFNAAPAGGAGEVVAAGPGVQLTQGEATHTEPRAFTGNAAVFSFEWRAPAEPGSVSWYAAAVSGNGDGATTGDAVATSERSIAVLPQPTPTPTPTETASTGSGVILTPTPVVTVAAASDEAAATPEAEAPSQAGAFGFGLSPQPVEPADPTSTQLAVTGAEVALSATLAVGLFATGAATIVAGRRRQR